MKVLIVDMTHGGTILVEEFLKLSDFDVFAWDIYKTLNHEDKTALMKKGLKFTDDIKDDFLIVAPIHCPVKKIHMTHHEAVRFLMQDRIDVPIIEVTGVKGKTSVVWMLKEIFRDLNPLVLSSLGVEVIEGGKRNVLERNISITPASIIKAWELSKGKNVDICIFEVSLGGTGLADVGVLTNIAEDYPIADGRKKASYAKAQILKSKIVACDSDLLNGTFGKFISDFSKINTFGLKNANVTASYIKFGLYETVFKVNVRNLNTINGDVLNTSFKVSTFAPAYHHVKNVLSAICASLILETPIKQIQRGLKNFRGIKGRTSIRNYNGSKIIEEINPGVDSATIRKAVEMLENFDQASGKSSNVTVIFGGKYGITCEEIDEKSVAEFFNELDNSIRLILTDEIGANIKNRIKREVEYIKDHNNAIDNAIEDRSEVVLLIYRSNFSDINMR